MSSKTDGYLGRVYKVENREVYMLYTSTNIKLIALIQWSGAPPKESSPHSVCIHAHFRVVNSKLLTQLLNELGKIYARLIRNPFYTVETEIHGDIATRFEKSVGLLKL